MTTNANRLEQLVTDSPSTRSRTYTWEEPIPRAGFGQALSGLDVLRGWLDGSIPSPPIARTLGYWLVEVEAGRTVFATEPEEYHYNPAGVVHGGLAAALLDTALSCAIISTLPAGVYSTTIEIKVTYIRPLLRETSAVRCEGRVLNVGSRVASAEGSIVDAAGKLYAHATTTHLILRPGQPAS